MVDPTFNIIFDYPLSELEKHPSLVYPIYKNVRDEHLAQYMEKAFANNGVHKSFNDSHEYWPSKFCVEKSSAYLIWVIPFF